METLLLTSRIVCIGYPVSAARHQQVIVAVVTTKQAEGHFVKMGVAPERNLAQNNDVPVPFVLRVKRILILVEF